MKTKALFGLLVVLLVTNIITITMYFNVVNDPEQSAFLVQVENNQKLSYYVTYEKSGLLFISQGNDTSQDYSYGTVRVNDLALYLQSSNEWVLRVEICFDTEDYLLLDEIFLVDDLNDLVQPSLTLNEVAITEVIGLTTSGSYISTVVITYKVPDNILIDNETKNINISIFNVSFQFELFPIWGYPSGSVYANMIQANAAGGAQVFDNYQSSQIFSDLYMTEQAENLIKFD